MAAQVETMASTSDLPWKGLGFKIAPKSSPEQMLKAAKLNWTVSKRPLSFQDSKGKWVESETDFALVRDSDDRHLSTVGTVYKPVQNADTFEFFKKFTTAGHMTMEHGGSLANGAYVWALARINADFVIGKDDAVQSYLLFCQPHAFGRAMVIRYMSMRTWCWNTLGRILSTKGAGRRGVSEHVFRMPHSMAFNDATKQTAELACHLGIEQAKEFKEAATLLSKKKAQPEAVEQFFCEVLKFDPKKATKKKNGEDVRVPNKLPKFRDALLTAPGQQAPTALGTWWGAVNAVTYVIDHDTGRERQTALRNAWLGHTAGIKARALDLALQRVR